MVSSRCLELQPCPFLRTHSTLLSPRQHISTHLDDLANGAPLTLAITGVLTNAIAAAAVAVAAATTAGGNEEVLAQGKAMYAEKAKDVALLAAKDEEDKAVQVAAAAKLAKKVKGKGGGKKKK